MLNADDFINLKEVIYFALYFARLVVYQMTILFHFSYSFSFKGDLEFMFFLSLWMKKSVLQAWFISQVLIIKIIQNILRFMVEICRIMIITIYLNRIHLHIHIRTQDLYICMLYVFVCALKSTDFILLMT